MPINRAVFMDRDGTLIESVPYLDNPSKLVLYPETYEAFSILKLKGYKLIIVTNQSGVGRGFFSLDKLKEIHETMLQKFDSKSIQIDGIYFCPHIPEDKCNCRKPEIGMLEKASLDLSINPMNSYMIGDRLLDIQAGQSFGCVSILVETGYGKSESIQIKDKKIIPDKTTTNIQTAAQWIVDNEKQII